MSAPDADRGANSGANSNADSDDAGDANDTSLSAPLDPQLEGLIAELAAGPAAPRWSLLGQQIGRYTLRGALGRGGMGEVYRAFDPELRREVALKVLHVGAGSDLLDEARAAARLSSPHIAQVYDVLTEDGRVAVAMELVDGPSLAALLETRRLRQHEVRRIARGVAEALAAAHTSGLVHRDVKPGNVLLRADGHPLLVDFGLAAAHGDAQSTVGGTPRYVAPEQATGAAPAPSADVFAFGVTLQSMLDRAETKPYGLRRLAAECVRTAPGDRPPDGRALVDALVGEPRRAIGWIVGALVVLVALSVAVPLAADATSTPRPPSLSSVVEVVATPSAQRSFLLAVQALYAGDRQAAARALQPVLAAGPTDPLPWMMAAHLRLVDPTGSQRPAPVERLREQALDDGPRADVAALAAEALSLKPWGPGQQVPEARAASVAAAVEQRFVDKPEDWLTNLLLVMALPRRTGSEQRLALLDRLERVDDDPPVLALARAWALLHASRSDQARAVLEAASLEHAGNAALQIELATLALDEGSPTEAIERLVPWVARRPQDATLRFSLAEAYLIASDGSDAKNARWLEVLEDLDRGGFDPVLVGRGALLFAEAVAARGRPDLAHTLRVHALRRLDNHRALDEVAHGLRRAVLEAMEERDAAALRAWRTTTYQLLGQQSDGSTARRHLDTTLEEAELLLRWLAGDLDDAEQRLVDLQSRPDDAFAPDEPRSVRLARLGALLAAARRDNDGLAQHLQTVRDGLRPGDLEHPPAALLDAEVLQLQGERERAAPFYRRLLQDPEPCLATLLYWEVRCRRDLRRALDGLAPESDEMAALRSRVVPLAR